MRKRKIAPGAVYLNVDLEVRSRSNLMPLVDALRPRLDVLNAGEARGEFRVSFEVAGVTLPPDVAIHRLARAVTGLPPSIRKLWRQARTRLFDIGLQRRAGRGAFPRPLRPESVTAIPPVNARLALTLS